MSEHPVGDLLEQAYDKTLWKCVLVDRYQMPDAVADAFRLAFVAAAKTERTEESDDALKRLRDWLRSEATDDGKRGD